MTIQECYQQMGGDYAQVITRLPTAKLVRRFIAMFLNDESYGQLCRAMEDGRTKDAFRAAHTLKGVCANLSFTRLFASSSALTELLRPDATCTPDGADRLLDQVRQDYEATVHAIRAYLDSEEAL